MPVGLPYQTPFLALIASGFNQLTNSGLQRLALERSTVNLTVQYLDSNLLLSLGSDFPFPANFTSSDVVVCAGFQFASPISGARSSGKKDRVI